MRRTFTVVTALACAAGFAGSASAAVSVSSEAFGLDDYSAASTVVNFESPLPPAGFTLTGGNVRNFSDGLGAEPAISQGVKESSYYLSANSYDPATITSVNGYKTLSFLWGSMDNYNKVSLLDKSGATIQSYIGGEVYQPANGDQGDASTNRRVTFTTDGSTSPIYGVKFESTSPAFEVDNVAFSSAVPEPASWAMMIFGMGGVGGMLRRGRKAANIAGMLGGLKLV